MTKEAKNKQVSSQAAPAASTTPVDNVVELPPPPPMPTLSEIDRMALELAKTNFKLAQSNAEKALAQNETAQLTYKYVVLQLYMKYGLTEADAIGENGVIIKGGALTPQGQ